MGIDKGSDEINADDLPPVRPQAFLQHLAIIMVLPNQE
jgi:hypothetical protein